MVVRCRGEILETSEENTYLGAVLDINGEMDQELSNRIKKANIIYYQLCNTVVRKRDWENKVKLHTFRAIYLHTLPYVSVNWVPYNLT